MFSRFLLHTFWILICIPASLLSAQADRVLDQKDFLLELEESRQLHGAVTISNEDGTFQEFYNHWFCFNSKDVSTNRIEIYIENEIKHLPQLDIEIPEQHFQFTLEGDNRYDTDEVLSKWQSLLDNSREVCIYAAFLQKMGPINRKTDELWIMSELKGSNGVWISE